MSAPQERRTLTRLSVVAGSAVTLAAAWLGVVHIETPPPAAWTEAVATGPALTQSPAPTLATTPPLAAAVAAPGTPAASVATNRAPIPAATAVAVAPAARAVTVVPAPATAPVTRIVTRRSRAS